MRSLGKERLGFQSLAKHEPETNFRRASPRIASLSGFYRFHQTDLRRAAYNAVTASVVARSRLRLS